MISIREEKQVNCEECRSKLNALERGLVVFNMYSKTWVKVPGTNVEIKVLKGEAYVRIPNPEGNRP